MVNDYSFDSFDGFNARDKLEIDRMYKQKNNSIYQPSFFGQFNNESSSQGYISHDLKQIKNHSDKMKKNGNIMNSSENKKSEGSIDRVQKNKLVRGNIDKNPKFNNPSQILFASSIKNKSDGMHNGSGDSFTLSNHYNENNLFVNFQIKEKNEKICKVDGKSETNN